METTKMNTPARRRPARRSGLPSPELAARLGRLAADRQAQDVLILDLRGLSGACDYFVLATGLCEPHLAGLADHLEDTLREEGVRPWHVEGRQNRKWILLDFVDVVVHLFLAETREYYRLENLWSEAPREEIRSGRSRPGRPGRATDRRRTDPMQPPLPVLVVGSVALDSVRTPAGEREDALGGSASYFGVAASHLRRRCGRWRWWGPTFPSVTWPCSGGAASTARVWRRPRGAPSAGRASTPTT